jgi:septal ring factor EnvC (AmiA/AmiB activator)
MSRFITQFDVHDLRGTVNEESERALRSSVLRLYQQTLPDEYDVLFARNLDRLNQLTLLDVVTLMSEKVMADKGDINEQLEEARLQLQDFETNLNDVVRDFKDVTNKLTDLQDDPGQVDKSQAIADLEEDIVKLELELDTKTLEREQMKAVLLTQVVSTRVPVGVAITKESLEEHVRALNNELALLTGEGGGSVGTL